MAQNGENAFVKVQFSVTDEFGKLVETTSEEEAKAGGIFNPKAKYGSSLIIVSEKTLIKGFREALLAAKEGIETVANMKKEDAFGDRKEDLVVLLPMKKFEEAQINPQVGMVVDLDGQRGRVQAISGGRVRVDMNHELAGKAVTYKFKIIKKYEGATDKLDALLEDTFGKKIEFKFEGGIAAISATQEMMKEDTYLQNKYGLIQAALQYIPELNKLNWSEEFIKGE